MAWSGTVRCPTVAGSGGTTNTSAVGDGVTDDTTTLQNEINSVGAIGGTLRLGASKTYRITTAISINAKNGWLIDGRNSTVKMGNGVVTTSGGGKSNFYITACSSFNIRDLTVDGNRANRTPIENYNSNILIEGGTGWSLENVTSINSTCSDGYMITALNNDVSVLSHLPRGFLLYNCNATNNFRNGMTMTACGDGFGTVDTDGQIRGGLFQTSNGTNPEGGIDIEPDAVPPSSAYAVDGLLIEGVTFTANDGISLNITSGNGPVRNITVRDCRFNGGSPNVPGVWNNAMGIDCGAESNLFQRLTFENFNYNTIRSLINMQTANGTYPCRNNVISDISYNTITMQTAVLYIHSVSGVNNTADLDRFFSCSPANISNNNPSNFTITNTSTPGARTDPSPVPPTYTTCPFTLPPTPNRHRFRRLGRK